MRILRLLVILFIVSLLLLPTPAFAVSNPSSLTVPSVRVFQNLWESGDQLYVVEYDIVYASEPSEQPEETFFASITDGVDLYVQPVHYYNRNFISIYLTPAQAATIAWGGSHTIRVSGNPSYFATLVEGTNLKTTVLSSGNWITGTLTTSPDLLQTWLVQIAEALEADWVVTLLTDQNRLNTTAAPYFTTNIPGLSQVLLDFYSTSTSYPSVTPGSFTGAYETTLRNRMGARLQVALNGLGTWVGIPGSSPGAIIGGVGLAIIYFILAGRLFIATGSPAAAMVVSIPMLLVGNIIGILPLSITFIAGFTVIVLFGVTFILARF